jgi:uncharacterized protein (TIGR02271 family)
MDEQRDDRTVGVISAAFPDVRTGERAMAELRSAGFERVEISGADAERTSDDDSPAVARTVDEAAFFKGHESTASAFVDELKAMGFESHDAHDLIDAMVGGGAIVTADATAQPQRGVAILQSHNGDIRYATAAHERETNAAPLAADNTPPVIALREERLQIEKQRVQHGEARVRKEVVTHLESIEVPISREELVIEHVSFNADGIEEPMGASDTVRIPLSQEVVNVSKTVTPTEEVRIGKRLVQETEHVSETTREERLRVSDTTLPTDGAR